MEQERKKVILIVEDEKSLFNALEIKLKAAGFQTLGAGDGEECLDVAFGFHPDLILLDIVMPRMDGLTALSKLRQDEWGKGVPVIVLTNLSNAETSIEGEKEQVTGYLVKADWKLDDVVEKFKATLNA